MPPPLPPFEVVVGLEFLILHYLGEVEGVEAAGLRLAQPHRLHEHLPGRVPAPLDRIEEISRCVVRVKACQLTRVLTHYLGLKRYPTSKINKKASSH